MIVLDASALMALVKRETGHEVVLNALNDLPAVISAVNVSEGMQKLHRDGVPVTSVTQFIEDFAFGVVPFQLSDARLAADLYRHRSNLSFADRACLATAKSFSAPAYTTDSAWKQWADEFGVQVVDIRER